MLFFDTYSSKFATFTYSKKISFFFEKTTFVHIWKMLLFESHSTANLLYFGDERVSESETAYSARIIV